jgi:hypothetical protein
MISNVNLLSAAHFSGVSEDSDFDIGGWPIGIQ